MGCKKQLIQNAGMKKKTRRECNARQINELAEKNVGLMI